MFSLLKRGNDEPVLVAPDSYEDDELKYIFFDKHPGRGCLPSFNMRSVRRQICASVGEFFHEKAALTVV